jgi:hypothetical protein
MGKRTIETKMRFRDKQRTPAIDSLRALTENLRSHLNHRKSTVVLLGLQGFVETASSPETLGLRISQCDRNRKRNTYCALYLETTADCSRPKKKNRYKREKKLKRVPTRPRGCTEHALKVFLGWRKMHLHRERIVAERTIGVLFDSFAQTKRPPGNVGDLLFQGRIVPTEGVCSVKTFWRNLKSLKSRVSRDFWELNIFIFNNL